MPIPTIFFLGFSTWGSHSHFVKVKYMTGGPIGRNVVYFSSPLCFLSYNSSSPYLCFPFVGNDRSHIRCNSYFYDCKKSFQHLGFQCNQQSVQFDIYMGWTILYHFFLVFLFLIQVFIFWVHQWNPYHSMNHLWLRFFMRILG